MKKKYGGKWNENVDLNGFSWLRLNNTRAKLLWEPDNINNIYNFISDKLYRYSIIGNGSNTLLGNINDVLIVTKALKNFEFRNNEIAVESGVLNYRLVSACLQRDLGGFEFLYTIPGTIGGAICMNAGAHGDEISKYVTWVEGINKNDGNLKFFSRNEVEFNYRFCSISDIYFITRVGIKLKKINPAEIKKIINQNQNYVDTKQPRANTLGSTFKNPLNDKAWQIINTLPEEELKSSNVFFSPLHRNFLIHNGRGDHLEVLNFITKIQKKVHERTGIKLELEIKILGNFEEKNEEKDCNSIWR